MFKVHYTKNFTAGVLAGLTYRDMLSFPTRALAEEFVTKVKAGEVTKGLMGTSDFRMSDPVLEG